MRNLLYGVILIIAGILIAMSYDWARDNFVPSPSGRARPDDPRVRFPDYAHLHENALRRFSEVPAAERRRLRHNLGAAITPVDSWLEMLRRSTPEVICLGERHDDLTRNFLAKRFFSHYPVDVLMLEMRAKDLEILLPLMHAGSPRLSMLDADIAAIIRSTERANPGARIHAIEETR